MSEHTVDDGGAGPLRYFGGKGSMSHKILRHFPRAESYIEPFFGGGGMFFAVPLGLYKIETVNDIYKQVVTFFSVLRNRTDELTRAIEHTPWSWDEFKLALRETDDELEAARRFWIRSYQGYAAKHRTTEGQWVCDSQTVIHTEIAEGKLAKLPEFAARIRHVQFDNRDFADFLRLRCRPQSFVYADPPYVPESRAVGATNAYAHEMSVDDHRRLADRLHAADALGAKVCLSGYDCELYQELFPTWRKRAFEVPLLTKRRENTPTRIVTEVLWMNYPEADEIGERVAIAPKSSNTKNSYEHKLLLEARRRMVRNG